MTPQRHTLPPESSVYSTMEESRSPTRICHYHPASLHVQVSIGGKSPISPRIGLFFIPPRYSSFLELTTRASLGSLAIHTASISLVLGQTRCEQLSLLKAHSRHGSTPTPCHCATSSPTGTVPSAASTVQRNGETVG